MGQLLHPLRQRLFQRRGQVPLRRCENRRHHLLHGSTASAAYFPDQVVDDNGTHKIDYCIIMPPTFEGGNAVAPQQGASMAVAKSDEQHEYASCEFLKWFTEKQNNLHFAATSSYLRADRREQHRRTR